MFKKYLMLLLALSLTTTFFSKFDSLKATSLVAWEEDTEEDDTFGDEHQSDE